MTELFPLSSVAEGASAVIVKVGGKGKFRRRLLEMGFVPGTEITVVKCAPLHDPWEYRLKGSHVSLRRSEAREIIVEKK
ncbi:MAG: ferrous iron transport protein A [Planctomycetota bacterium]|nr:MAG: ferrous iron transport protein A [Planctomycetota bacterium]